jgi:sugar phosphate isomerase/epimerase
MRDRTFIPPMLIGIKLEIGFSQHPLYHRLYGDRDVPSYLRSLGFTAAETPISPETSHEALRDHVARCREAGLRVSLHPYCERTDCDPSLFSTEPGNACLRHHERFLSWAAEISQVQQSTTVVNIHPAAAPPTTRRRDLVDSSISFFSWARQWCSHNAPDLRVVAELQFGPDPGEPIQRAGDNYDELVEIATQSGVRACWDFGHAYFNARRFDVPLHPPQALLERIGHVHCHDVRRGDHCPLVYDTLPWRDFIESLILQGFDDTIIIEVPPSSFLEAGGIESVAQSIENLKGQIARCKQEPC